MLSNLSGKHRIILGIIAALVIFIPTTSYVISQSISKDPQTSEIPDFPVTSSKEVPNDTPLSKLQKQLDDAKSAGNPLDEEDTSAESATLLIGPSVSFKVVLEGRPAENQSAKVFLGVAAGQPAANPKYVLSFMLNIPPSGEYKDLSLAGLDEGNTYTAYFKGPSQIATSSSFMAKTSPTDLGIISMLTGDVNDDNVINALDQTLVKAALGAIPTSESWKPQLDFNVDQRINTLDLSLVNKNLNKTGASGPWYSGIPQATSSASISGSLNPNTGSTGHDLKDDKGYWIWVPTDF
jgi:hypothetical protein